MEAIEERIEKAALLHDIGKLLLRAKPERKTHSAVGVEYQSLEAYLPEHFAQDIQSG